MRTVVSMLLLTCVALVPAVDDLNVQLEAAVKGFEDQVDKDFVPVAKSLDGWRGRRKALSLKELSDLLSKAPAEDKVYVAYHLLAANPRHKPAREVFTKLGIAAPYDDKGVAAEKWTTPACRNPELVDKVSATTYPPFSVVSEAVYAPNVKAYYKRTGDQLGKLKTTLIELARAGAAQDYAAVIYPILAYYHPEAQEVRMYFGAKGKPVPRQRVWFNPVDRWLLDHELAGSDCLDPRVKPSSGSVQAAPKGQPATLSGAATWLFPEYLRNCRIEGVFSSSSTASLALADDKGNDVTLAIVGKTLTLTASGAKAPLGEFPLELDLAARPVPIQLEARGKVIAVRVGGLVVGTGTLPSAIAFHQATVSGTLSLQQLRIRYLADLPESLLGDEVAAKPEAKPEPPAEPAWMATRRTELDKKVTFEFSDTPMEEVVAMFGRLTGATFALDASADTLKDLPISLSGNDMSLKTALEWITRFSGLEAVPGEQGFSFAWEKG